MILYKCVLQNTVIQHQYFRSSNGDVANDPEFAPLKEIIREAFPSEEFQDYGHVWGTATPESTYLPNTILMHKCTMVPNDYPAELRAHPNADTLFNYTKIWNIDSKTISYQMWWVGQQFGHPLIDDIPEDIHIRWFGLNTDDSWAETGKVIISLNSSLENINKYLLSKGQSTLDIPDLPHDSSVNIHYDEATGNIERVMPFIEPDRFSVKGDSQVYTHGWLAHYASNAASTMLTHVHTDSHGRIIGRHELPKETGKHFKLVSTGRGFARVEIK